MNCPACVFLFVGFLALGSAGGLAQQSDSTQPAAGQEHDHSAHGAASGQPLTPISPLTDEDRAAAFPNLEGHATHDSNVYSFVLFDQLEWRSGGEENALAWNSRGWIGGDIHRFWFRTEGESDRHRVYGAEAHFLYGRAFSRWWDVVAGLRQDVRPGPARTWAAIGIQGLAPYFFEVEATAYVGAAGRTQARLEVEYEMLITNRMILQPRAEIHLAGKSDPQRGIGSGLSSAEAGLRLRYEFRREFAPYVGITWNRKFGRTADFSRALAEDIHSTHLTTGIRFWF